MPFAPGDPWPGSPGGAARIEWSGYVRIFVQAQISAGNPFTLGPDPADRLNAGNTLSAASLGARAVGGSSLWVDLTCDVIDVEVSLGAKTGDGILTKPDAGTVTITLYDPDGKYDPMNPDTPYALGNRTRLTPGVPVRVWAEVINNPNLATPGVLTYGLFYGTADRWQHNWTREPSDRTATLVATDPTKNFVRFDKPALVTPVGAGDDPLTRLNRIKAYFGYLGTVQGFGLTVSTLQATTMGSAGWELVTRVAGDELGFAYFIPSPNPPSGWTNLVIVGRPVWTNNAPAPSFEIGCGPGLYDIATEVIPEAFDEQLVNAVYAARSGGVQQTARVQSSIDRFYEQSIDRTDLGLADDAQAGQWATAIVSLYAYPQTAIKTMRLRPDLDPKPWNAWRTLGIGLVTATVRVLWEAGGYTVDTSARVVGWTQKITASEWSSEWRTVNTSLSSTASAFTLGPDPQDMLDAGYVLG